MIEDPPLLTVKRPTRRPTPAQIAAFQGVPTSFVVDAMQGGHVLDRAIRPLKDDPAQAVAGPALTADNQPGDILALFSALPFLQPGDVLVSAAQGYQGCAAMGDRAAAYMKNCGAAGVVTDGLARDYAGILEVGLPVWCTGLSPDTPQSKGPGKVGTPVIVGGEQVETGDMIVADYDGVVIVPFDRIDAVIEKLKVIKELEDKLDADLKAGLKVPPHVSALLSSDQTTYLE